jgi:hypothetical protein
MCQPAFQVHTHMIACLQVVVPSMCKAHHYADIDMAEERALPCGEVACDSVHCLPNARDEIDGMNTVVGGPSVCPARSLWLVDLISDKTTSRRGTSRAHGADSLVEYAPTGYKWETLEGADTAVW